jgi:hypothetical protein
MLLVKMRTRIGAKTKGERMMDAREKKQTQLVVKKSFFAFMEFY